MRAKPGWLIVCWLAGICLAVPACRHWSGGVWEPISYVPQIVTPNPLSIPCFPRELVMDEVSDEIDDYFRILREQRIRLTGHILTEGYIDTEPRIGSTALEPWRLDSTPGFELAHATLQTVRRWAKVRVIPTGNQYLIDVKVYKELEDLETPEGSVVGGPLLRHDNSLDHDRTEIWPAAPNKGWIPMGRDFALEETILANLQARFERLSHSGIDAGH